MLKYTQTLQSRKWNLKKINKGNVLAEVLMFEGPLALSDPDNPDEKRIGHILEENLTQQKVEPCSHISQVTVKNVE